MELDTTIERFRSVSRTGLESMRENQRTETDFLHRVARRLLLGAPTVSHQTDLDWLAAVNRVKPMDTPFQIAASQTEWLREKANALETLHRTRVTVVLSRPATGLVQLIQAL